jgi:hypothetical protein
MILTGISMTVVLAGAILQLPCASGKPEAVRVQASAQRTTSAGFS